MSLKASIWAWEQDVSPSSKLVLLAIADQANDSGEAWPAHSSVSDRTGLAVSTVKRCLDELKSAGLLTWKGRVREGGLQTSNVYQLTMTQPVAHDELPGSPERATRQPTVGYESTIEPIKEPNGDGKPPKPPISPMDSWIVERKSAWVKCIQQSGGRVTMDNVEEWRGVLDRCFGGEYVKMGAVLSRLPIGQRWPSNVERYAGTQVAAKDDDDPLAIWRNMETNGRRF